MPATVMMDGSRSPSVTIPGTAYASAGEFRPEVWFSATFSAARNDGQVTLPGPSFDEAVKATEACFPRARRIIDTDRILDKSVKFQQLGDAAGQFDRAYIEVTFSSGGSASGVSSTTLRIAAPRRTPVDAIQRQFGSGAAVQSPSPLRAEEHSNSVQNTLDRLRVRQEQNELPLARAHSAPGVSSRGSGSPTSTAPLTSSEIRGLADKISECWSVDAGAPDLSAIVVEMRVEADAQGVVRVVRPAGSIPSDSRARAVYEAARRVLLDPKCMPLPLARDRTAAINSMVLRFNPRGLVR
jgi:hypothetical protein